MAKLSDIAEEVGVSNKTVSMTLRGMKCASPEIARKIHAVSDRIGYVASQAARDMQKSHSDFIGLLGNTMGKNGVNIANFTLGRSAAKGEAIALLYVDEEVPQPVIDQLHATGLFKQIKPLEFDVA